MRHQFLTIVFIWIGVIPGIRPVTASEPIGGSTIEVRPIVVGGGKKPETSNDTVVLGADNPKIIVETVTLSGEKKSETPASNSPEITEFQLAKLGFNVLRSNYRSISSFMTVQPLDSVVRNHLKVSKDRGLLVSMVVPGSPPALAGIHTQDILLTLGDVPLANSADLSEKLREAGDKPSPLTLLREGVTKTIQVQPWIEVGFGPVLAERPVYAIGVTVRPADPLLRSQLKLSEGQGLVIIGFTPASPAEKAGLKPDDILLSLNGAPLTDIPSLFSQIQSNGEKNVTLEVIQHGDRKTITVKPEKQDGNHNTPSFIGQLGNANTAFILRPSFSTSHVPAQVIAPPDSQRVTRGDVVHVRPVPEFVGGARIVDNMTLESGSKDEKASSSNTVRVVEGKQIKLDFKEEKAPSTESVTKRLDEMSAQIDTLRKAIDELTKAIADKK